MDGRNFIKSENRVDKIGLVELNSPKIYQFTLSLYGVLVLRNKGRFPVHSPFIEKSMIRYLVKKTITNTNLFVMVS